MWPVRVSLAVYGRPLPDNYVVVDESVKLCELIGNALTRLGFGHLADGAQGFIQVGNWKPLTLNQISDDHDQPAAKLFKPIAYDIMLKIVVHQDQLKAHSPAKAAATPLVPKEIEELDTSDPSLHDSETADDDSEHSTTASAEDDGSDQKLEVEPLPKQSSGLPVTPEQLLRQFLQQQGPLFDVPLSPLSSVGLQELKITRSPSPDDQRYDPLEKPAKPCFDTIYEVPMLQRCYAQIKFPGKAQCQLYADELNLLSHRQTSPSLSWQTVSNWFKNRRRRKGVMPAAKTEILEQTH